MSKIEVDLQNLSTQLKEIEILTQKKTSIEHELENLVRETNKLKSDTDKEIIQKKQQYDIECQEKMNEINIILKQAQEKFNLAEQREKDSKTINEQVKKLEEKKIEIAELQKQTQSALSSASEREHKANILIEQYTKKLDELGVKPEGKKEPEEKPKKKK